jgi:glucose-1-phosphate thymidylyltransferase
VNLPALFSFVFNSGIAGLDTGTFASLNEASTFVRVIEERQDAKHGCIEEVAYYSTFITKSQLLELAEKYPSPAMTTTSSALQTHKSVNYKDTD